jgi:hypothetical protein
MNQAQARRILAGKRNEKLGREFENQIEAIANLYRRDGLAYLRKIHTKQDHKGRYRAKVAGDYTGPVEPWGGVCALIECKVKTTMFERRRTYDLRKVPQKHQVEALDLNERCGGISLLVIQYSLGADVAAIPWGLVDPQERWSLSDIEKRKVRLHRGLPDILSLYRRRMI